MRYKLTVMDTVLGLNHHGYEGNDYMLKYSTNILTVQSIKDFLNNIERFIEAGVEIDFQCTSSVKGKFYDAMLSIYMCNKDGRLVFLDKEAESYKAILQKELNDLGFLTIMRNNEIIVVDKISNK